MLTKQFWGRYFKVYDVLNLAIPYQELMATIAREANIQNGDLVLDVGVGTGNLVPYLVKHGARAVGLDFYYFKPSEFINIGKIFYFQTNQQMLVRIFSGVMPLVGALVGSAFFMKYGFISHNQQLKTRVYLLGTGMSVLVLATILNYFIFSISFSFLSLMGASLVALTGLVIIGLGVLKKPLST